MLPSRHHARYLIGILLLAGMTYQPTGAFAQTPPNRYALFHIQNKTPDITIQYKVRWGTSDWNKPVSLKPGEVWDHWWEYPTPNQNSSPTPQITFQSGIDRVIEMKVYDLKAYAVPNNKQGGGMVYSFDKDKNASGVEFLDLYAPPTPEQVAKKAELTNAQRETALRALESYRLGSRLTPEKLKMLNELPSGELMDKAEATMSADTKKFIAAEITHFQELEMEMTAAADVFLSAALQREQNREAKGQKLYWLYGPVTAPNARPESKDGLAGLRVIGRLDMPDGKQLNAIFAVKYHPNPNLLSDDEGRIGLVGTGDNFRMQVRHFSTGKVKNDYAFQSFSVTGEGKKMKMQPGFYVDTKTGMLNNKEVVSAALGTSCINCHLGGPKLKAPDLALMEKKAYAVMEGLKPFVEQIKHWGASKTFRRKVEEIMTTDGPASLLPLQEMQAANREYWISLYTGRTKSTLVATGMEKDEMPNLVDTAWSGSENLSGFGKLTFQFKADGKAVMIDAKTTTNGTWTSEGERVVIVFNNCTYVGQWDGKALRGAATFMENQKATGKPWTFVVSPGG